MTHRSSPNHPISPEIACNLNDLNCFLFEEAADGMFISDLSWRLLAVNLQFCQITGYARQELLDMSYEQLGLAEDFSQDPIPLEDLRQGRAVTKERRFVRKDGGQIEVWVHSKMMPNGKILGIARDITDRKQAEKTLRNQEEWLRQLLEQLPVAIALYSMDGKIIYSNRKYVSVVGYTYHDIKDMTDWWRLAYTDPLYMQEMKQEWEKRIGEAIAQKKEIEPLVAQIRCKDGQTRALQFTGTVIGNDIAVLVYDLTEKLKADEILKEQEHRLRTLGRNIPGAIYQFEVTTDKQYRFPYVNGKWLDLCGISPEDAMISADSTFAAIHPDDVEGVNRTIALSAATLQPWQCEFRTIHENETKWILGQSIPEAPRSDGSILWNGVLIDITEQKKTEESKDQLQAQLLQAQKMESVGRLAGGVAHDFNNMLGVIVGYAEMAMRQSDPAGTVHRSLGKILDAAGRSANLTRQLLAFARKQTIAPKVLDLNETVESILKMLRRLIGEDIDLAWLPRAGLWPVLIDPSQVDQILANLCVNARDAIPGVGKITIETGNITFDRAYCAIHAGFVPGSYTMLAVSDNGTGMDTETLEKVFEPFFTTKGLGQGTGLGLSTVYGIVKQNNGFINVYSEPGIGSTFRIYLPRHEDSSITAKVVDMQIPIQHGSETILLVEDELEILEICTMMLEDLGYRVLSASTTEDALRLMRAHSVEIGLLITDVIMPEMNGRDLANLLSEINPGIQCLFTSGYTANVIAHHGVLEEGVYFLQKPFSGRDLGEMVRKALERK